jgi:hypothetical protein
MYAFTVVRKLSLSGLAVNETFSPAFSRDTLAYTAYIPGSDSVVNITATAPVAGYTLTIGGRTVTAGTDGATVQIVADWDTNGQMVVPIVVSSADNGAVPTTYTLTLIKETPGAAPQFNLQPKTATYFDSAALIR